MATDPLRPVTCHDTDNQRPTNRNQHTKDSEVIGRWRNQNRAPSAEIKQVGEEANQAKQYQSHKRCHYADAEGHCRYGQKPCCGGEISENVPRDTVRRRWSLATSIV